MQQNNRGLIPTIPHLVYFHEEKYELFSVLLVILFLPNNEEGKEDSFKQQLTFFKYSVTGLFSKK